MQQQRREQVPSVARWRARMRIAFALLFVSACDDGATVTSDPGELRLQVSTGDASSAAEPGCSRASLASAVNRYFAALAAHDSTQLPTAPNVKFTENGTALALGEGIWTTAGALRFKRTALDPTTCSSVTESVITENGTDIVLGVRLKLTDLKVGELETIVVRKGDYLSNPAALIATASDDWETPLPTAQRASRAELEGFVDRYLTRFPAGGCKFANACKRYENGFSPGNCSIGLSCSTAPEPPKTGMPNRLMVIDVEAGIGVGFTMFQGRYTDFHMFKVRGGEVVSVHAVLAKANKSGW